jgi:lipoprotein-releasing system permease protein
MSFFELSVALKYLTPRWRQLSQSIISLISIIVISLVIWLIVVFFSVTYGLEKSWTSKLISLTAPIRITPTEEYYRSYYYLIDSFSHKSDYRLKSLREKEQSLVTNPYDPSTDEELPWNLSTPYLNADGTIKDLVKTVFHEIHKIPDVQANDYEIAHATLKLKLVRPIANGQLNERGFTHR